MTSVIPARDVKEDIAYLLTVLNSSLLSLYAIRHSPVFSGGYHKFSAPYLKALPIRRIDWELNRDVEYHDQLVRLGHQLTQLHASRASAATAHQRNVLDRQIASTDVEINRLVYELYGLSEAEIAIVEEATAT